MQFDYEAFGSVGHAFIGGNEFGGPKLEGGGNMDAVQRAEKKGRTGLESGLGDLSGPGSDIVAEGSEKEAALPEVALEFRKDPWGGTWRNFAFRLFGAKGKYHFILENDAAGERLLRFGCKGGARRQSSKDHAAI